MENKLSNPRVMISALGSDEGKTTITCGLLKIFKNKGLKVQPLKYCSDFVDALYHSSACDIRSYNIDPCLVDKQTIAYNLYKWSKNVDITIMEGAMGYYDGLGSDIEEAIDETGVCGEKYSPYIVAKEYGFPVILVVDGKYASFTLAAMIKGIKEFRQDNNICGVILNRVDEMVYSYIKTSIERECDISVLGYLPELSCNLKSSLLGLDPPQHQPNWNQYLDELIEQLTKTVDLDKILEIANSASKLSYTPLELEKLGDIRIAIAYDDAFCFYYYDSIELLTELGAKIIYFSPLKDNKLPDCDGLIIGGGYPYKYAAKLENNIQLTNDIKQKIAKGLPCYASSEGFDYLQKTYCNESNKEYSWLGICEGKTILTDTLVRFGYVELTTQKNSILCNKGNRLLGQEYHCSNSNFNGNGCSSVSLLEGTTNECIFIEGSVFAGYPYINFWTNLELAKNFIKRCLEYKADN